MIEAFFAAESIYTILFPVIWGVVGGIQGWSSPEDYPHGRKPLAIVLAVHLANLFAARHLALVHPALFWVVGLILWWCCCAFLGRRIAVIGWSRVTAAIAALPVAFPLIFLIALTKPTKDQP